MPDPADTKPGLGQSVYDFNYRVFPSDLGQEDMAHYMVININVPTMVSGSTQPKGYLPTGSILGGELSKVDTLRKDRNGQLNFPGLDFNAGEYIGSGLDYIGLTGLADRFQGITPADFIAPQRRTTRIKESIALHMPNGGLVYTEENKYEEVSMTAMLTGVLTGTLGKLPVVGSLVNSTASAVKRAAQIAGYPINPAVEVLFASRPQRQWVFEIFMLPRSEEEMATVKEIIRTFRYHAAPEIIGDGFFFVPPAEFDITFFHNGSENKNLPRINTCALQRIDVDYAPDSAYSTFANGHPVATRLTLAFTEVEVLHKQRVYEGF